MKPDDIYTGKRTDSDKAISEPFGPGDSGFSKKSFGGASGAGGSYLTQLFMNLGGDATLKRPYAQSPWVNACIRAISRNFASVPLRLRKGPNPDDEVVKDGPLVRLLQRPNPVMSGRKWQQLIATLQMLSGEHFDFMLKMGVDGKMGPVATSGGINAEIEVPDELWTMRGEVVDMELDPKVYMPAAWKFQAGDNTIKRFDSASVWHPYDVDPYSPFRGMGPMQAAYRTASKDYQIERFDEALVKNGGQPSGIYVTKDTLSQEDREEIKASHDANVGSPRAHRRPMVLSEETSFQPLGHKPTEMDLRDLRLWDRDIIMSLFGVTKPILGITDDVNRANAEEAKRVFWEDTMIPFMEFIADELTMHFLRRVRHSQAGVRDGDHLFAFFDTSGVEALSRSGPERISSTLDLMNRGGRSWNEAVAITRLDAPIDAKGGDLRFIDARQIPSHLVDDLTRGKDGIGEEASNKSQVQLGEAVPVDEMKDALADRLSVPDPMEAELTDGEREWRDGQTTEKLAAYADSFEKALVPHDKRIGRVSAKHLRLWLKDMQKRLNAYAKAGNKALAGLPDTYDEFVELETKRSHADIEAQLDRLLLKGIEAFEDEWNADLVKPFDVLWDDSAKRMANELGVSSFFRHDTPEAMTFLRDKRILLSERGLLSLEQDVKRTVLKSMVDGGATNGTLAKRLEKTLAQWNKALNEKAGTVPVRAERIARTENTAIANASRSAEMKKDGVKKHMWIAASSGFPTRPHHIQLNRRVRKVGSSFGFGLKHPGDPSADASETINCRCTTAPAGR